jgi:hypothetical protein
MKKLRQTLVFATLAITAGAVSPVVWSADEKEALVEVLLDGNLLQVSSDIYMAEYAKEFVRTWKTTLQPMDTTTENVLLQEFTRKLSQDQMSLVPAMKEIYLSLFTLEELKAMVDFYASPHGKNIATKMNEFDRRISQIYYPGINDMAIKHWNDTVTSLRAAGNKL